MEWAPDLPTSSYKGVVEYFKEEADYLIEDLKQNRLEVVLTTPRYKRFDSHKVRTVTNRNPQWYRDIYHDTPHFRRDRCMSALTRIKEGQDGTFRTGPYKYDSMIRDLIFDRLTEGYDDIQCFMPARNEVRIYFSLEPYPEEEYIEPEDDLADIPF